MSKDKKEKDPVKDFLDRRYPNLDPRVVEYFSRIVPPEERLTKEEEERFFELAELWSSDDDEEVSNQDVPLTNKRPVNAEDK